MNFFLTHHFRPSLWPSLGALILLSATVALGHWQWRRAEYKQNLQQDYLAARALSPIVLPYYAEATDRLRYRSAIARGEYVSERQILLDNAIFKGRAGYFVITPLRFSDETAGYVLVNRGWVAQGRTREQLPLVTPVSGVVEVGGRLNNPSAARVTVAEPEARVWPHLDLAAFTAQTGWKIFPLILELHSEQGDKPLLQREWLEPQWGVEKHLSYMVQWYSLAGLTVILFLLLNWRKRDAS